MRLGTTCFAFALCASACVSGATPNHENELHVCMDADTARAAFLSGQLHDTPHQTFGEGAELQNLQPDTPLTGVSIQFGGSEGWMNCSYFNEDGEVFSTGYLGYSIDGSSTCQDGECQDRPHWRAGEIDSLPELPTGAFSIEWTCAYRDENGGLRPSTACAFR